jgi:hypothetical protein
MSEWLSSPSAQGPCSVVIREVCREDSECAFTRIECVLPTQSRHSHLLLRCCSANFIYDFYALESLVIGWSPRQGEVHPRPRGASGGVIVCDCLVGGLRPSRPIYGHQRAPPFRRRSHHCVLTNIMGSRDGRPLRHHKTSTVGSLLL